MRPMFRDFIWAARRPIEVPPPGLGVSFGQYFLLAEFQPKGHEIDEGGGFMKSEGVGYRNEYKTWMIGWVVKNL